jgi:tripartite-type tricarboxylate transporter receptor subunit TctC
MTHLFTLSRRNLLRGVALATTVSTPGLFAQPAWPVKPIRFVIGYPAGGGTDVVARAALQSLADTLSQSVVIDNKTGASGNIAAAEVARSPADGYTLLVGPSSQISINPHLFKMGFNPDTELVTGPAFARFRFYLVTRQGLAARNLKELVEMARANPGKITYGSSGNGTPPHLVAETFLKAAGIKAVHVPYRGAAPAVQALLGGEVDFVIDPGVSFPHVKAGKLKMLGVPSAKRAPAFPDVPTFIESGFAGMDYDTLVGIWAPAGTPAEVLQKMSAALSKAVAMPAIKERFGGLGAEGELVPATEFHAVVQNESRVFSGVIKDLNLKVE